jgi:hypothetical protein
VGETIDLPDKLEVAKNIYPNGIYKLDVIEASRYQIVRYARMILILALSLGIAIDNGAQDVRKLDSMHY